MKFTGVWWVALALVVGSAPKGYAEDWPQWRFDAYRSADSPEELPPHLSLQWTRSFGQRVQAWEDPLNQDLMPYDRALEPVVLGNRMFVGLNDRDKVLALDIDTGRDLWGFFADGPVRLPVAAALGKAYFASDDGCLYCVQAEDGELVWKVRGGPSARKVLGNGRLISAWPARGGPVVRDGQVYFAASIWPFMGTFVYALNALTGGIDWVNDSTGFQYLKQPHSAPSFAGVAPQGALVATREVLLVPGGRSVPAAFDRKTGRFLFFQLEDSGKGNGGSFVAASDSEFYVHTRERGTRSYELKAGKKGTFTPGEPVLTTNRIYSSQPTSSLKAAALEAEQKLAAARQAVKDAQVDVVKAEEEADSAAYKRATNALGTARKKVPTAERALETARKALTNDWAGFVIQAVGRDKKVRWELKADGSGDLIKAGERLYAAGTNAIVAIDLPGSGGLPRIAWSNHVDGRVVRLLAARQKLFAVTLDGRIMAFGAEPASPAPRPASPAPAAAPPAEPREGYALWFGLDDGRLLEAMLRVSQLHVIGVDPDRGKVDRLRRRFDAAGLYGARVALHAGEPLSFQAPPYLASLAVVGEALATKLAEPDVLRAVYQSVRPYGGLLRISTAHVPAAELLTQIEAAGLPRAKVSVSLDSVIVQREGALPGSADWTHQYGNVANTLKSDDQLVKLPLGLLWFGGNSHSDVLPRHGHGPSEQIVGGRLFIEGMDCLSARDVYTGRVLWKTELGNLGTYGVYYDASYTNLPLTTAYNQRHIPGAGARGANFVATEAAVYVAASNTCLALDAATGHPVRAFVLPKRPGQAAPPDWGYLGVCDDLLLAGEGIARFSQWLELPTSQTPTLAMADLSASRGLAVWNRRTGQALWQTDAHYSFLHNGIVAGNGRVYCLDKLPKSIEDKLKRRGRRSPGLYRIAAFDARNGTLLWEVATNVLGTWLSYSKADDVLLLAGASATDRLKDEAERGMAAYRGKDGALLWTNYAVKYTGPCILYKDLVLTTPSSSKTNAGAFGLLDGKPRLVVNPLTRQAEPWRIFREYGCNYPVASEHLLTFRSGAAGYYDLETRAGTGNFGGYKSGCSPNLIAADGVLNSPDYTRTCSCPYQNQTSLALVHSPELELWTYNEFGAGAKENQRVERVGINFGAPGDRLSDTGTLWLDYPSVGGRSPYVRVVVKGGQTNFFRHYAARYKGEGPAWVMASGVREVESIVISPETGKPPPAPAAAPAKKSEETGPDEENGADTVNEKDAKTSRSTSATSTNRTSRATRAGRGSARATGTNTPAATLAATNQPAALAGTNQAGATLVSTNLPEPAYTSKLTPAPYTVRLYFAEPDSLRPGERVFEVELQGRPVLRNFDIIAEAGGSLRGIVREFKHVMIKDQLALAFNRASGKKHGPLICGVELILEITK